LYYYTNLQGWTLTPVDWNMEKIEALRGKGATLLVVVPRYNDDPNAVNYQKEESTVPILKEVEAYYPILYESQGR